jgi:TldD protein
MTFPEHELHFFQKFGLTGRLIERCLGEALSAGGDFADLYFESVTSTAISVDESLVKSASQGVSAGCGIRVVSGDRTGYAYTDDLSAERLMRAARTAALIADGPTKQSVAGFRETPKASLYPISAVDADAGIAPTMSFATFSSPLPMAPSPATPSRLPASTATSSRAMDRKTPAADPAAAAEWN